MRLLAGVQLVYALACLGAGLALIFDIGPAAHVTNGTSVRVLGAALLSFGIGALTTIREPQRDRALLKVEIVFTALTAVSLAYRLVVDHNVHDRAWLVLLPVIVCLALLAALYPREPVAAPTEQASNRKTG